MKSSVKATDFLGSRLSALSLEITGAVTALIGARHGYLHASAMWTPNEATISVAIMIMSIKSIGKIEQNFLLSLIP